VVASFERPQLGLDSEESADEIFDVRREGYDLVRTLFGAQSLWQVPGAEQVGTEFGVQLFEKAPVEARETRVRGEVVKREFKS
jgi:hypothetical protein